jgi:hypothetical protein
MNKNKPNEIEQKVFPKHSILLESLSFSNALELCEKGYKIMRKGWSGKDMYVFYIGVDSSKMYVEVTGGWTYTNCVNDNYPLNPMLALKDAPDRVSAWQPNQLDLFAKDWCMIELQQESYQFINSEFKNTKYKYDMLERLEVDEPIFILRAKDSTAANVIRFWAGMNSSSISSKDIIEVTNIAELMSEYRVNRKAI